MRECAHLMKAEQPRNLGHVQLAVIKRAAAAEVLVTRDFSRESCQPSTRHCELRCARDVGFEPVSAAVFWIFRF